MKLSDEEFLYHQEIREKKSIGAGAFHKKNGSKSKKCTLPHEKLTRKEIEKLSGEVKTWDLKKFYSWKEFKEMPEDIQLEYVNSIINRYDVGLATISTVLFKKSAAALSGYFSRHDLLRFCNNKNCSHTSTAAVKKFRDAVFKESEAVQNPSAKPPKPIGEVISKEETEDGLQVEVKLDHEDPYVQKFIQRAMGTIPEAPLSPSVTTSISDFLIRMDQFDDNIWETIKYMFSGEDDLQITISITKGS